MPIENLARVSRSMLAQSIAEHGSVILDAGELKKHASALPPRLRQEVEQLLDDARSAIPNDFILRLVFEFGGVGLSVDFEDGNTGSIAMRAFFTSRKSMLRKCREFDWDAKRAELIKQGSLFEDMVEAAKDRPANIPSSAEAAKSYVEELAEFFGVIEEGRESVPPYLLAFASDDTVVVKDHPNRDELISGIGDCMTHGCDILAVAEKGRPWSFPVIETAKLEAVEGLGPISRAKAERRMVF